MVIDIAQKMKIIEVLESEEKIDSIARRFVVNGSTVRTIRDNKDKIRHSATQLDPLWVVVHYAYEPTYEESVRSLLRLAREIGGEGSSDMSLKLHDLMQA